MDAALLDMMRSGRNKNWAETMVNLEARKLINTANRGLRANGTKTYAKEIIHCFFQESLIRRTPNWTLIFDGPQNNVMKLSRGLNLG